MTAWGVAFVLTIALLVALAYLVAAGAPKHPSPLSEVLETLSTTGVAFATAVALLTTAAWCFRHVWFERLAPRPGRIEVGAFAADPDVSEAELGQLTLHFRKRLAELRLRAPASVPGAALEGDFLEVLGRAGVDSRNWLGSAFSLLRAAKPLHAWQVSGVLVKRTKAPQFGFTVEVQRLPNQANLPTTRWADSWLDAVRHGADEATAAILPRTRRCGPPWGAWRRYWMDGRLIGAYEDAVGLERERRYDEALEAYYRASSLDPLNMSLRLHIGQLQEKLALYLDALNTYQGMVAASPSAREIRSEKKERSTAVLVARYRSMVLLGGRELVEQWRMTGPVTVAGTKIFLTRRDQRRQELRERLRRELKGRLAKVAAKSDSKGITGFQRAGHLDLATLLDDPKPGTREEDESPEDKLLKLQLRELFALAALADERQVLRRSRFQLRDGRLALSPDSVQLTGLCIEIRLKWIQHKLSHPLEMERWVPDVSEVEKDVKKIEARSLGGFHRWHEHYNAACAFALPLLELDEPDNDSPLEPANQFALHALGHLAEAASLTNSAFIVGRRDWLLSEDPDLDGLRSYPAFRDFETRYFPAEGPTPDRPREVKKLENARYIRNLLLATAKCWERVWHARWEALERRSDVHAARDWWDDELEAWNLVGEVARNYRHWHTRWRLHQRMREWAWAYQFHFPEIEFPRYADKPLSHAALEGDNPAHDAAKAAADMFKEVGEAIARSTAAAEAAAGRDLQDIRQWQRRLRELDAGGREPRRLRLAMLCDHHAALWQRLQEWLEADDDSTGDARNAFNEEIRRASRLWCNTSGVLGSRVLVVAGGRAAIYRFRGSRNGPNPPQVPAVPV